MGKFDGKWTWPMWPNLAQLLVYRNKSDSLTDFWIDLAGEWRLCSSSAGRIDQVADWLKVFQIDQTVVSSEVG